ncbi:MAG: DinB family protein [Fimbriimonadaceae bacterium]|jgi:uncharacterized damage-inducible protein DinB|nr:DinB family protein [Fimbriimonadaceae bacterium]
MTHEEAFKPMDSAIWEMSEAFEGLQDEDVWKRAHPRILSVGELATHVAFSEIRWLHETLSSPLVIKQASYYRESVDHPLTLPFGAKNLYNEVKRVHEACKSHILELRPDLSAVIPGREDWTWGYTLEYMAFHIAYHTGQIYSVRHLMGHETADN